MRLLINAGMYGEPETRTGRTSWMPGIALAVDMSVLLEWRSTARRKAWACKIMMVRILLRAFGLQEHSVLYVRMCWRAVPLASKFNSAVS